MKFLINNMAFIPSSNDDLHAATNQAEIHGFRSSKSKVSKLIDDEKYLGDTQLVESFIDGNQEPHSDSAGKIYSHFI